MARYVVTFDTDDYAAREISAPALLAASGFTDQSYFPRLGIGVVTAEAEQLESFDLACREQSLTMTYAPELTHYAISAPGAARLEDTRELTWGLQAIGITEAQQGGASGAGVRVAVLDTGFNSAHPDFASRSVVAESFVDSEGPEDAHGHGTHCIGTACGPWDPQTGPGYGVAAESEIYSGKVLGDDGSGTDTSILAGIDWALENDCQIISMSLGADEREVHPPYETAGRRALESGTLIIAAAGNNAQRSQGDPGFVGAPANSPNIMAIAAVDQDLQVADFSARSSPHDGGEVDLAAPGVDVYSAWTQQEQYQTISGTSMATPHASGIAAIIYGAAGARGEELWQQLVGSAAALEDQDTEDVGAGLAQVPEAGAG